VRPARQGAHQTARWRGRWPGRASPRAGSSTSSSAGSVEAAITYDPAKAGGIDKALLTLGNQPFGEVLLFLAALGLIIFGIYGLCEARWRRVRASSAALRPGWRSAGPGRR